MALTALILGLSYEGLLQAMMELGACICTVHQPPACNLCPIRMHCQAYGDLQEYVSQGGQLTDIEAPLVSQYPSKVSKIKLAAHSDHCFYANCKAVTFKPLLFDRPARPQGERSV